MVEPLPFQDELIDFDDRKSIIYRWAKYYGSPNVVRTLVVEELPIVDQNKADNDLNYRLAHIRALDATYVIINQIFNTKSLYAAWKNIQLMDTNMEYNDFYMFYFRKVKDDQERAIKTGQATGSGLQIPDQLPQTLLIINNFKLQLGISKKDIENDIQNFLTNEYQEWEQEIEKTYTQEIIDLNNVLSYYRDLKFLRDNNDNFIINQDGSYVQEFALAIRGGEGTGEGLGTEEGEGLGVGTGVGVGSELANNFKLKEIKIGAFPIKVDTYKQLLLPTSSVPGSSVPGSSVPGSSVPVSPTSQSVAPIQPTIDDGLDIFNLSRLNYGSPYIRYNGEGKSFFKVYQGRTPETTPNLENTILSSANTGKNNSLFINIWTGDDINKDTQISYTMATYNLEKNFLNVPVVIDDGQTIDGVLNNVQTALPSLQIGETFETGIRAEFSLYAVNDLHRIDNMNGIEFNPIAFLDQIATDDVLNAYLYVDESDRPSGGKGNPKIRYSPILKVDKRIIIRGKRRFIPRERNTQSSISFQIKQEYLTDQEVFIYEPYPGYKYPLKSGTPYVRISISHARSNNDLDQFIKIFRYLFIYYLRRQQIVVNQYNNFLPNLMTSIQNKIIGKEKTTSGKTKGKVLNKEAEARRIRFFRKKDQLLWWDKVLKNRDPNHKDLFTPTDSGKPYVRDCQCRFQPIIITPPTHLSTPDENKAFFEAELEAWRNYGFYDTNLGKWVDKRQVLQLPDPDLIYDDKRSPEERMLASQNNPQYWVVCPGNVFFYPYLKKGANPCCGKRNMIEPGTGGIYNNLFRGTNITKTGGNTTYLPMAARMSKEGRYANINNNIKILLKGPLQLNQKITLVRYGLPHDSNSFIHCVLYAIKDIAGNNLGERYKKAIEADKRNSSFDARTTLVNNFRRSLAELPTTPALVKQEMYDFSDEEIRNEIRDVNIFFDPARYYRLIEENLQVNIFTFVSRLGDETSGDFDIPRHKLFYARPRRVGKTVNNSILIFKNDVPDENKTMPQCDLVVRTSVKNTSGKDRIDKSQIQTYFSLPRMIIDKLFDSFYETMPTLTWSTIDKYGYRNNPDLITRLNLFYQVNFLQSIPSYSQDNPDGMFGQIIDRYGKLRAIHLSVKGEKLTIITIPGQPLNLPIDNNIYRGNNQTISGIFTTDPSAITRDPRTNLVNGYWYSIYDIPYGIYCPLIPYPDDKNMPIGPTNTLIATGDNSIARLRKLKRLNNVILQFVQWLFILSRMKSDDFIANYLLAEAVITDDSITVYNIDAVGRQLPIVNTLDDGIAYVRQVFPTLLSPNGKIRAYSIKFYSALAFFIRDFERVTKGLSVSPSRVIRGRFVSEKDFKQQSRVAIFMSMKELDQWRNTQKTTLISNPNIILRKLNIELAKLQEPFLFKSQIQGNIYLVQNVFFDQVIMSKNDSLERALFVALNWYLYRINPGYMSEALTKDKYMKIKSLISSNSALPPSSVTSATSSTFSSVATVPALPDYIVYSIVENNDLGLVENKSSSNTNYLQILRYPGTGSSSLSGRYAALLPLL